MITISIFVHPYRAKNLDTIYNIYKDYDIVDEVIIVTGKDVTIDNHHPKFKFVHLPGPYTYGQWPYTGLLGRYIFAQISKNNFVFIQDDDCIYNERTLKDLLQLESPLAGTKSTPRWFYNEKYQAVPPKDNLNSAEIIITRGLLVKVSLLPKVLEYAKEFWKDEYQNVFNGEDIFLSRAISKITGQQEFPFVTDWFTELPVFDVQLDKRKNKKGSRTEICKKIYNFFN